MPRSTAPRTAAPALTAPTHLGGQRCGDHEDRGDSTNYRKLAEHEIGPPQGRSWLRRTNVWRRVTSPARGAKRLRGGTINGTGIDGQIGMLTPARSRRFGRPRCPRCKLRVSKRSPVVCPNDAEISCVCCDHCRRECALDAKRSQLKRS